MLQTRNSHLNAVIKVESIQVDNRKDIADKIRNMGEIINERNKTIQNMQQVIDHQSEVIGELQK